MQYFRKKLKQGLLEGNVKLQLNAEWLSSLKAKSFCYLKEQSRNGVGEEGVFHPVPIVPTLKETLIQD